MACISNVSFTTLDISIRYFNVTFNQCACSLFSQNYSGFNYDNSNETCTLFPNFTTNYLLVFSAYTQFCYVNTPPVANTFVAEWNKSGITVAGAVGIQDDKPNRFDYPFGIALDSTETILYIADQYNHRVQKWVIGEPNATTIAGLGTGAFCNNSTCLYRPTDIVLDSGNNLYVADTSNHRVQLWINGATVGITVAGTGSSGSASNELNEPIGLALDTSTGLLYIADSKNNRVVRYPAGVTNGTVVAGGNGAGFGSNQLYGPFGLYFEASSNSLLIANNLANNVVRWILGNNNWTFIWGSATGAVGSSSSLFHYPTDVISDSMGNVYVADTYNDRIQMFASGQTNGTTVAGISAVIGSNSSLLHYPCAVLLDSHFNLFVSDTYNQRIQRFPHQ